VDDPGRLRAHAAAAVQDPANDLLLSAGTIWELSIKIGLGKLSLSLPCQQWMTQAMADLRVTVLPVTVTLADVQAGLPWHHRDPFDRLLVAQAQVEGVPIVSCDAIFDQYGVARLW
jgi:PIN domain nuclease of toxin-antitoxin system